MNKLYLDHMGGTFMLLEESKDKSTFPDCYHLDLNDPGDAKRWERVRFGRPTISYFAGDLQVVDISGIGRAVGSGNGHVLLQTNKPLEELINQPV